MEGRFQLSIVPQRVWRHLLETGVLCFGPIVDEESE